MYIEGIKVLDEKYCYKSLPKQIEMLINRTIVFDQYIF